MSTLIPFEKIESKILVIRNQKVILDKDLAELYGVETKVLNQTVKRKINRFPEDFMFQLSKNEYDSLRSQFVTSKKGGRTYFPYAFTENGVAMLSSVLNSERAILVNIQIMRIFTRLRALLSSYEELKQAILTLKNKHDEDIDMLFMEIDRLDRLIAPKKQNLGFKINNQQTE